MTDHTTENDATREEWGHAHADQPDAVVVVSSEAEARRIVARWNGHPRTDGKGLVVRRIVSDWQVIPPGKETDK